MVSTGPKISSRINRMSGRFASTTVGSMKYPLPSSAPPPHEDLSVRVLPGTIDIPLDRGISVPVDHRANEVPEVRDVADADLSDLLSQQCFKLRPERRGDERPRGGRALLPLVLEGPASKRRRESGEVGRSVGEDEILPARLPPDP